jgi:ABC-type glycerol-3-phosphate transport system permease component
MNSVLVDGGATVITLAIAAPAAYVLSRTRFRGVDTLSYAFVLGIGIPVQAVLIPLYVLMANTGLLDSLVGLAVAYVATTVPFIVFLLTGYFRSLPRELEEAAAIDGANAFRTFLVVMVPVAWPGILTAAIFELVALWSEFFLALTLINSNQNDTLPLAIVNMYATMKYTGDWSGLFAGVIIVVLPITVAYGILSKRMMEGLTLGAVK